MSIFGQDIQTLDERVSIESPEFWNFIRDSWNLTNNSDYKDKYIDYFFLKNNQEQLYISNGGIYQVLRINENVSPQKIFKSIKDIYIEYGGISILQNQDGKNLHYHSIEASDVVLESFSTDFIRNVTAEESIRIHNPRYGKISGNYKCDFLFLSNNYIPQFYNASIQTNHLIYFNIQSIQNDNYPNLSVLCSDILSGFYGRLEYGNIEKFNITKELGFHNNGVSLVNFPIEITIDLNSPECYRKLYFKRATTNSKFKTEDGYTIFMQS